MKIETFNELLKAKHTEGHASVFDHKVSVTFKSDGKAYGYNGTILAVAERLDLIPTCDIAGLSQASLKALLEGKASPFTPIECSDTMNYLIQKVDASKGINEVAGTRKRDKHGRQVCLFEKTNLADDPWNSLYVS